MPSIAATSIVAARCQGQQMAHRLRAVAAHLHRSESATEDATELAASTAEFRSQGVAVIRGLVDPSALEGLRQQCQQALVASSTTGWAAEAALGWCSPGYIDSPELLEAGGGECLKVLQDPRLLGLMQAAVGADAHLVNIQAAAAGGPTSPPPELRRNYGRDVGELEHASFLHPVLSEAAVVFIALSDHPHPSVAYIAGTSRLPGAEPLPGDQQKWSARA